MKMSRFLSLTVFVTSFCVLYVYQQSEIFRLAYLGSKRQSTYNELLDKNTALSYNIKKSSSLVKIGSRINGADDFQMPDRYRFVKVVTSKDGLKPASQNHARTGLLAGIFGLKREAQAKTINP
ncbi:MAG: hypothetical protein PHR73_07840 [Candidatus Omnitrophica bacterium]|nr:hypothetical protein [Candidatus Omnitrophota bacterium]